ncbi:Laminin subunit alpha-3 [Bagarius yarrelli]|uniref:Laminin subunit alpha-3 n=1 Tax=Bagarius yarrelli TaxID=175774 RepID=A0A556V111_BAGYA|nr:Laminin subunit alpha-3 [Bagarius yarrelli]
MATPIRVERECLAAKITCQCHSHSTDCYYDAEVERRGASLNIHGRYDGGGVCMDCQHNTAGVNCEVCAEGYYRPHGVPPESPTGCIRVTPGLPVAVKWVRDGVYANLNTAEKTAIAAPRATTITHNAIHVCVSEVGQCQKSAVCLEFVYAVLRSPVGDVSAVVRVITPSRTATGGSLDGSCDPLTGQCVCNPGVTGHRCDRCIKADQIFPDCFECLCDVRGTLAGVAECHEESGECSCKPNICSHACDTCDDGYFLLQKKNYFGCQGCQCDVGGAVERGCDELSENGITPNARPVRFGYDTDKFPEFSWRGYATLSRAQPEVLVYAHVTSPGTFTVVMRYMTADLHTPSEVCVSVHANETHPPHFLILLRYANPNEDHVSGRVTVTRTRGTAGSGDSKEVLFPPSRSPAFLTVPGDGFVQPFTLSTGKWIDYLVLLPSAYYEAKILQQEITEPCSYQLRDANKHCIQSQFHTPPTAITLDTSSVTRPSGFSTQTTGRCDGPLLKSPQTEVELRAQVPQTGRYMFLVHYCQPEHTTFPVEVLLDSGEKWTGHMNASFCPSVSGCRSVVIAERRIALDVLQQTLSITLKIPKGKTLTLDSVLVIPEESYSPELLNPKPLDQASDFISQCGAQRFHINLHSASEFCKSSARSLVAHYLDGALPCYCDKAGAISPTCEPIGGQCQCRPHVIGRQCSRCATGFYGFPYCRPCECGRRLCDEVTGECICPPQTVRPACNVCQSETFSYHPLLGCEGCDCSPIGIRKGDTGQCDVTTGQCTNTVVADLQELPASVLQLHWLLPQSYLGDRVSSYGGFLTYHVKSFGLPHEGMSLLDKQPDVILKVFVRRFAGAYRPAMKCGSGNFRHSGTNRPVSRAELMRVLARLEAVRLRALYFTHTQRLSVGEVGLEEASVTGTGAPAGTVEVCSCPPEYTGDSCQNCQENTAGDHCERCKEGYYGNAALGTCAICPCPLRLESNKCAPGYYGRPEQYGGRCQPCNCNGNSCSPTTGVCNYIQDPKDTNPSEECTECDSCAQTLLNDLERLEAELERLKRQLDSVSPSSEAHRRLKELEKAIAETKNLVTTHTTEVKRLKPKVSELERDRIRGLLNNYEEKLKELQKALRDASETVHKANTQNTLNAENLNEQLNRIKRLEKEKTNMEKDITSAKQQLKDVEDLLKMLSDSKKEYEQLAAELDGAKSQLTDRVNSISQTASQERLVKNAEDRAALLNKLANELQQAIQNSSGRADVKDALAAVDAYKNITEAIKAAEEAAKKAKEAADKALNDVTDGDISKRAKDLKDQSTALQKDAKQTEKEMKKLTNDLKDQTQRLDDAEKKKTQLEKDLRHIDRELNDIKRDDITTLIDLAKKTAQAANTSASDTMNKLKDINAEINAIKELNMAGSPDQAGINGMLSDADMAVKNLSNSIPSLLDKFTQVEKLSSELDTNNNISYNIMRIKELIDEARNAADRILLPMKFTGTEHVELRLPETLDDMRAFTSMSLLLQRNEGESRGDGGRRRRQGPGENGDLFVLYLGNKDVTKDYLGMALRNNILYFVYKLNGRVTEIESVDITLSKPDRIFFDKVDMRRIYEDAQVNLTKLFTTNNPDQEVVRSKQGDALQNLLDLHPDESVFYVGGYPENFIPPPPLNYPRYKGCIEFNTFNERFISLYNFKSLGPENVTLDLPCKRYIRPGEGEYLEGTGYIQLQLEKLPRFLNIIQTIETRAENGIILYMGNKRSYYLITLEKHYVVLQGKVGNRQLETKRSDTPQDLNGDFRVFFDSNNKVLMVRFKTKELIKGEYVNDTFSSYFVGGIPSDLRRRHNITVPPLKGYVKDLQANGKASSAINKVGALRKAEFGTGGSLNSFPTGFSLDDGLTLSLGFKSTEKDGLLLQNRQASKELGLSMMDGYVVLKYQNRYWRSKKQYQDGEWHYVTVTNKAGGMELRIDEDDRGEDIRQFVNLNFASSNVTLGAGFYTGCMSNVYLRRFDALYYPEDLSEFSSSGDVMLDTCMSERQPENMWADRKKDGKDEIKDDGVSGCFVPTPIPHSFHLAGSSSSLSYIMPSKALTHRRVHILLMFITTSLPIVRINGINSVDRDCWLHRPYFSLDIRTKSAEGLVFYIPANQEKYHLALYVSKGRIRLSVGRQREIFHREKYNDGKWHTVTLSLEKRRFRLVIDGLRAQDGVLNPGESSSIQLSTAVYLGSPPSQTHTDLKWKMLPVHGVVGCVRNFRMNDSAMVASAVNRGVGPCFEGQMKSGAYFSGQGAYIIIDDSFVVRQKFELVFEMRPSNGSGLLLHTGNSDHHLSVFMRKGEVVAQVNNGGGEFSVSVQPKQTLCDGMFHRIAVIQQNNVVEMHVDTEGKYTIGPSAASPTRERFSVFVGGVADRPRLPFLPVTESYTGCLQNMVFNRDVVVFEKLSAVFGPVNMRECPAHLRAPSPH